MKVKKLIENTIWLPGSRYGHDNPKISILLPTFRRAQSGLFRKAVESVINQTMEALELIIIDDASTDGTAAQIKEFMALDGRVSCLTHPTNIGLPAVSEFEGFQKARGEYIAFQFDDDEFHLDAFEKMLSAAARLQAKFVYGHVDLIATNPETGKVFTVQEFGRGARAQTVLQTLNYISNNAVMLHRSVIDTVGFYDPNVAITRLCDYDLWRRCAQHYTLHNIDVAVGKITGPATTDSLGHTYAMERWLSHEWMGLARNEQLLPKNFAEVEVLAVPEQLSAASRLALLEIHAQFSARPWYAQDKPVLTVPDGYILVVTASHDASVSLFFEGLHHGLGRRIRFVNASLMHNQLEEEIIGASAIIFCRALFDFVWWIECARKLRVPHYYFLDDNLSELAKLPEYQYEYARYSVEGLSDILRSFEGVLCSTDKLADYFIEHNIHDHVRVLPPALIPIELFDNKVLDTSVQGEVTVLFFGGGHRAEALNEFVLPAIAALCASMPVRLVTVGLNINVTEVLGGISNLRLLNLEKESSYALITGKLKQLKIDILVHPAHFNPNNVYKTLNVLINAAHFDAVPMLSDCEPFSHLVSGEVAHIVASNPQAWIEQLFAVASNLGKQKPLLQRLHAYVAQKYSGSVNAAVIANILSAHPAAGLVLRQRRYDVVLQLLKTQVNGLNGEADRLRGRVQKDKTFGAQRSIAVIIAKLGSLKAAVQVREAQLRSKIVKVNELLACKAQEYSQFESISMMQQNRGMDCITKTALSSRLYREYDVVSHGVLEMIRVPLSFDPAYINSLRVGVELVRPDDVIEMNIIEPLSRYLTKEVVEIKFKPVIVASHGWRIRIFVRGDSGAVYLYERRPRALAKRFFSKPQSFFELQTTKVGA